MANTTFTPDQDGLFEPWTDPTSGITSYVLTRRVAPVQQSFYFTNPSLAGGGRYLWFYAAHPPGGSAEIGRTLGVADLEAGTVTWLPETQFRDASPFIDPDTAEAYWCWGYSVFRRRPEPDGQAERVNSVPEQVHRNRYGKRLATHLTRSADGKAFFIDAHFGHEWVAGALPLDGSDFEIWQTFDRSYNHAQFSPTDSQTALIAQDWWIDVATGAKGDYDNRIWLIRRGEPAKPVLADAASLTHEWWDPDGRHIWYVDYQRGTEKVDIDSSRRTLVWPAGRCHSHASRCGRYLVGDLGSYSWTRTGCRVAFFNAVTGGEVDVAGALPAPPIPRGDYHIDPHPQFCADDSLIAYTTTVHGRVDVALVKVEDLIEATS